MSSITASCRVTASIDHQWAWHLHQHTWRCPVPAKQEKLSCQAWQANRRLRARAPASQQAIEPVAPPQTPGYSNLPATEILAVIRCPTHRRVQPHFLAFVTRSVPVLGITSRSDLQIAGKLSPKLISRRGARCLSNPVTKSWSHVVNSSRSYRSASTVLQSYFFLVQSL